MCEMWVWYVCRLRINIDSNNSSIFLICSTFHRSCQPTSFWSARRHFESIQLSKFSRIHIIFTSETTHNFPLSHTVIIKIREVQINSHELTHFLKKTSNFWSERHTTRSHTLAGHKTQFSAWKVKLGDLFLFVFFFSKKCKCRVETCQLNATRAEKESSSCSLSTPVKFVAVSFTLSKKLLAQHVSRLQRSNENAQNFELMLKNN